MSKSTVLTILGAIVAIVIAWFLVDVVFKVAWFFAKVGIIAVVAVVVFVLLQLLLRRRED